VWFRVGVLSARRAGPVPGMPPRAWRPAMRSTNGKRATAPRPPSVRSGGDGSRLGRRESLRDRVRVIVAEPGDESAVECRLARRGNVGGALTFNPALAVPPRDPFASGGYVGIVVHVLPVPIAVLLEECDPRPGRPLRVGPGEWVSGAAAATSGRTCTHRPNAVKHADPRAVASPVRPTAPSGAHASPVLAFPCHAWCVAPPGGSNGAPWCRRACAGSRQNAREARSSPGESLARLSLSRQTGRHIIPRLRVDRSRRSA
jgi:hypothetical protein